VGRHSPRGACVLFVAYRTPRSFRSISATCPCSTFQAVPSLST
jgi:hypothetical protein